MRRKVSLCMLAFALSGATLSIQASPIEHIGDRYMIHVSELDLRGDESLMDILMMCPDVITIDGKTPIAGDPLANLYGKYVVRFDNVEYGLDYNTLLHNLKAREIEKIQVCTNAGVLKGSGSQKKVIDIHLNKDMGGIISGRQGLFGDTYGEVESITSVRYHGEKLRILSHLEGNLQSTNHRSHEGAKVNMIWDITPNDNLEVTATQTYTRNRLSNNPANFDRFYNIEADYLHTLSKNGSTMLLTIATDHINDNGETIIESSELDRISAYRNHTTAPYGILEFNFPLFIPNLWLTAGFEGGLTFEKDCLAQQTTHSDYEDFYVQADLTLGKWGFMAGDRFRLENSSQYNAYTLSAYHHFNEHRTLQASFSQQFYNDIWCDADQNPVYMAELKHTFTKKKLMLSSQIRYISQDTNKGHLNTFQFGNTLFWHLGVLRLTTGLSSYREKLKKIETGEKITSQYYVFKLAPQLSLPYDWRLTSTLLWSTRRDKESLAYAPANLYAEAAIYKTFGKHWLLEARYHDIASQHLGNRAATIGCTYYF